MAEEEHEEPAREPKRLRSQKTLGEVSERMEKYGETNEIEIKNIIASLCDSQGEEKGKGEPAYWD